MDIVIIQSVVITVYVQTVTMVNIVKVTLTNANPEQGFVKMAHV